MMGAAAVVSLAKAPRQDVSAVRLLDWAYRRQRVLDDADPGGFGLRPARDSIAKIEQMRGVVGCRIDGGAWKELGHRVHQDAHLVCRALAEVDAIGVPLVVEHALAGTIPTWDIEQTLSPIYLGGRPEVREIETVLTRYRSGHVRPVSVTYCPLEVYPAGEYVDFMRGLYSAWFSAIEEFADAAAGAPFSTWRLSGLGAEKTPWARS